MQAPPADGDAASSDDTSQGSDTGYSETCSSNPAGSGASLGIASQPELFLGLAYNATTGQLAAEVIKGSAFRSPGASRAPDTFVKLSLVTADDRTLYKSRTPTFASNPNPMWKESFVYPVNKTQLGGVTLKISVWAKKAMKRRDLIGCFSLGFGGHGEEERSHWQDMSEAKGAQVCRWHRLLADKA